MVFVKPVLNALGVVGHGFVKPVLNALGVVGHGFAQ